MRNWENVTFQSDDYIKNEFKKGFDYIWKRLALRTQHATLKGGLTQNFPSKKLS